MIKTKEDYLQSLKDIGHWVHYKGELVSDVLVGACAGRCSPWKGSPPNKAVDRTRKRHPFLARVSSDRQPANT